MNMSSSSVALPRQLAARRLPCLLLSTPRLLLLLPLAPVRHAAVHAPVAAAPAPLSREAQRHAASQARHTDTPTSTKRMGQTMRMCNSCSDAAAPHPVPHRAGQRSV